MKIMSILLLIFSGSQGIDHVLTNKSMARGIRTPQQQTSRTIVDGCTDVAYHNIKHKDKRKNMYKQSEKVKKESHYKWGKNENERNINTRKGKISIHVSPRAKELFKKIMSFKSDSTPTICANCRLTYLLKQ